MASPTTPQVFAKACLAARFDFLGFMVEECDVEVWKMVKEEAAARAVFGEGQSRVLEWALERGGPLVASALVPAVRHGCMGSVVRVLGAGADVNAVDGSRWTALMWACEAGDAGVVLTLLAAGAASMVSPCALGWRCDNSALHVACKHNVFEVVQMLITAGAVVNSEDRAGESPLHVASRHGHGHVVLVLVGAGANVNVMANCGTPLHVASRHGHGGVVRKLIRAGAGVGLGCRFGKTPLQLACQHGHVDAVSALLSAGAHVNHRGFSTQPTPLEAACKNGHGALVPILVRAGADVNQGKPYGSTPLELACGNHDSSAVLALIAAGVAVNTTRSLLVGSPLSIACRHGSMEVVLALLAAGADAGGSWSDSSLPLHAACKRGDVDIALALIQAGADVDAVDVNVDRELGTPVRVACEHGHVDVVVALGSAGADMNKGHALHLACKTGARKMVLALFAAGAGVDAFDADGDTPLILACRRGDDDVVSALLGAGADVDLASRGVLFGAVTALHAAFLCQKHSVMSSLVAAGADVNKRKDGIGPPLIFHRGKTVRGLAVMLRAGADYNARDATGVSYVQTVLQEGLSTEFAVLCAFGVPMDPSLLRGRPAHECQGRLGRVFWEWACGRAYHGVRPSSRMVCKESVTAVLKQLETAAPVDRLHALDLLWMAWSRFEGGFRVAGAAVAAKERRLHALCTTVALRRICRVVEGRRVVEPFGQAVVAFL